MSKWSGRLIGLYEGSGSSYAVIAEKLRKKVPMPAAIARWLAPTPEGRFPSWRRPTSATP